MKVFVASWFFPPATSSEGIVTYKLLRNSKNIYHVFSSESKQWGYKSDMRLNEEENISSFTIRTDDIDEWVDWCVQEFCARQETESYDVIMTRSTPPESILIGNQIKEKYPNIKWIASLADPVANNPYELKAYIDENSVLSTSQKGYLKSTLRASGDRWLSEWEKHPDPSVRLLCKLKRWEDLAIENADLIISPTNRQLRYILEDNGWNPKFFAVPHSFDETFYREPEDTKKVKKDEKVVLSFLGYSDKLRSLRPIVEAVRYLKQENSPVVDRLEIHFIGNNPREIKDMVLDYYLDDYIHFSSGVDYYESLRLMQQSDWLIHIDAYFENLIPGGSIFFAGKLADYMGAKKPILAITGKNSPAYNIITRYGGVCCEYSQTEKLAMKLEEIANGYLPEMNWIYREEYNARKVALLFDDKLNEVCGKGKAKIRNNWPEIPESIDNKVLTICVPSYNVQKYLDRCLFTLVDHDLAPYIEILVVDDGSKDNTAEIARAYETHYPGIVRLISKENGGHGSTINVAIEEAQGKYFRNVDGDDWVDSDALAKLLKQIMDEEIDADVITANYHEIDVDTAVLTPMVQEADVEYNRVYTFDMIDPSKVYLTIHSMIIKTDILKRMNVKLQEHTFYVDVEYILFPIPYVHTLIFSDLFIYKYARGNAEQSVAVPNMVKRYEQHNRVLQRVIMYGNRVNMEISQKKYYDEIVKRVLCTHYLLSLFYDENKTRGCERAKEFDHFLKKNRPDLFNWIGKKLRIVSIARQCSYDPKKIDHSIAYLIEKSGKKALEEVYSLGKVVASSTIAKKIVYNQATLAIAQSEFFTNGKGKLVKEKVNKIFG